MKIWYSIHDNGDGSYAALHFATMEEAEEDARREEVYVGYNVDDGVGYIDLDKLDVLEDKDTDWRLESEREE